MTKFSPELSSDQHRFASEFQQAVEKMKSGEWVLTRLIDSDIASEHFEAAAWSYGYFNNGYDLGHYVGVAEFTRDGERCIAFVGEGHVAMTDSPIAGRFFFMSLSESEGPMYDGADRVLVFRGSVEPPYPADFDRHASLLDEKSRKLLVGE